MNEAPILIQLPFSDFSVTSHDGFLPFINASSHEHGLKPVDTRDLNKRARHSYSINVCPWQSDREFAEYTGFETSICLHGAGSAKAWLLGCRRPGTREIHTFFGNCYNPDDVCFEKPANDSYPHMAWCSDELSYTPLFPPTHGSLISAERSFEIGFGLGFRTCNNLQVVFTDPSIQWRSNVAMIAIQAKSQDGTSLGQGAMCYDCTELSFYQWPRDTSYLTMRVRMHLGNQALTPIPRFSVW